MRYAQFQPSENHVEMICAENQAVKKNQQTELMIKHEKNFHELDDQTAVFLMSVP